MYKIKLMNEFLHGPLWVYDSDDIVIDLPLIDEDPILKPLNQEGMTLYSSFFNFNTENAPCEFDQEGYKKAYPKMVSIVKKIIDRLNDINDGSFIVENYIDLTENL